MPPSPEELGRFFPQMEITRLLGRGGMGAVYQARQKQLDRTVALKILPPSVSQDPAFAERFAREARALAKLTHPHIVTLYEFGQVDGLFYFLMEYVDGVSLRQLLQFGRISPREALAIVPQVCEALQYAHDRGIVHRDIKPENILLNREGQVKITDFGVARIVQGRDVSPRRPGEDERTAGPAVPTSLTEAGRVVGTPQYMAPEQVARPLEVDHRADIYSLGVVLYQMLTGELPGKPLAPPSRKVQIDVRLDEVVLHALEQSPERRYQQVSEVKTAVEAITTPTEKTAEPKPTPSASWEAARRRVRAPATALLVLGVLGFVLCGWPMLVQPVLYELLVNLCGLTWLNGPLHSGFHVASWYTGVYLAVALGAARMRRLQGYGVALAGAVLAMVTPPLLPLGLPVGLWALVVLARRDTRREFGMAGSAGGPGEGATGARLSRLAVAGAALALVPLFYEMLPGVGWWEENVKHPGSGWLWVLMMPCAGQFIRYA